MGIEMKTTCCEHMLNIFNEAEDKYRIIRGHSTRDNHFDENVSYILSTMRRYTDNVAYKMIENFIIDNIPDKTLNIITKEKVFFYQMKIIDYLTL